jgi:hypothetical protein
VSAQYTTEARSASMRYAIAIHGWLSRALVIFAPLMSNRALD